MNKNIGKEYLELKENPPSIEDLKNIKMSEDMDFKDVVYKNTNGKAQTLDIYGPEKKLRHGSPVILYVHGGSWVYGCLLYTSKIMEILRSIQLQARIEESSLA